MSKCNIPLSKIKCNVAGENILFELVVDQEGDRSTLAEDIGSTLEDFSDVVPEDDGLLGDAVESRSELNDV